MRRILFIALVSSSVLHAMEPLDATPIRDPQDRPIREPQDRRDRAHQWDDELMELSLTPRSKDLAQGPRMSPRTPTSSPRIVQSLASPRRLSLANLLPRRLSSSKRTLSSSKLEKISTNQKTESPPTRKRLSFSGCADYEKEMAHMQPPRLYKRPPISGEEDSGNFKMIVFNARNRLCTDILLQKKTELAQAVASEDAELIKQIKHEIHELDGMVMKFGQEQRDWLVDCLLEER